MLPSPTLTVPLMARSMATSADTAVTKTSALLKQILNAHILEGPDRVSIMVAIIANATAAAAAAAAAAADAVLMHNVQEVGPGLTTKSLHLFDLDPD